jgi:hypothetical protein
MDVTILAVDLGKFNSLLCWYEPGDRGAAFRNSGMSVADLTSEPVAVVTLEACAQAGRVRRNRTLPSNLSCKTDAPRARKARQKVSDEWGEAPPARGEHSAPVTAGVRPRGRSLKSRSSLPRSTSARPTRRMRLLRRPSTLDRGSRRGSE